MEGRWPVVFCLVMTLVQLGMAQEGLDDSAELMAMMDQAPPPESPQQEAQQQPSGSASLTAIKTGIDEDHKELEQVYMMVMMVKAFLGSLLMFVTPIIRIKSFGLALINTIINIAKFLHEINFFKPLLAVLAPPGPSGPPAGPPPPDDRWAPAETSTQPAANYGPNNYKRIGTDHHHHSSYLPQDDWSYNSVYH